MNLPEALRRRVREQAGNRCGYCLSPQQYVMDKLQIEHILPRFLGGSSEESNLWLSCGLCNRYKGTPIDGLDVQTQAIVPLFSPRKQKWQEHFSWDPSGTRIIGLAAIGRATVEALKLNNEIAVEVRRNWIIAGWHPPEGDRR